MNVVASVSSVAGSAWWIAFRAAQQVVGAPQPDSRVRLVGRDRDRHRGDAVTITSLTDVPRARRLDAEELRVERGELVRCRPPYPVSDT
jgi:hypothetical protein